MGNTAINRAHMCSSVLSLVWDEGVILTVLQVKYCCVKWQISQRGDAILEGKIPLIALTNHKGLMCPSFLQSTRKLAGQNAH